jgi:hypothetical protein
VSSEAILPQYRGNELLVDVADREERSHVIIVLPRLLLEVEWIEDAAGIMLAIQGRFGLEKEEDFGDRDIELGVTDLPRPLVVEHQTPRELRIGPVDPIAVLDRRHVKVDVLCPP